MRVKLLQAAVVILASLALASGIAYADEWQSKSETKTIDDVQVEFLTEVDGMVVGENHIAVQLRNAATGQPIARDTVRVELTMDTNDQAMNHGDMSKQETVVAYLEASKDVPGKYSGKVSLSDAGNWRAKVVLDAQRSLTFDVHVEGAAASGPNWLVVGGFVGFLGLVVGSAAVLKRNAAAAVARNVAVESSQL